jgi:hypothetical protein
MARISVRARRDQYWITVTGRLSAADLRRLERACGPALEQRRAPITLRLQGVRDMDNAARGFLQRLVDRGATIADDSA